MLRAMGPATLNCWKNTSSPGPCGTSPNEVRSPYTLLNAAGVRSDPIMSEPSATGSMCSATATPAPPLLPPAERAGSKALRVVPYTAL